MNDFLIYENYKLPGKVAITPKEQAFGLMYCSWPPPIMIFPSQPGIKKFWMKNTPFSLDLIFCYNYNVIDILTGEPFSEREIGPAKICDLVIEMPYGLAKKINIVPGSKIKILYSLSTWAKILRRRINLIDNE